MRRTLPMLALAILFASAPLFAQQPTEKPREGSVNDRRDDQQQRIANGVQSGQLTAGETKRLETREMTLNHEVKTDRQANGGRLTPQERRQVNRQQNNLSGSIYNDKHNARQAHSGKSEVGQRRENQQDRVAQGIRSGQMTAGEAARTRIASRRSIAASLLIGLQTAAESQRRSAGTSTRDRTVSAARSTVRSTTIAWRPASVTSVSPNTPEPDMLNA